MTEAEFQQQVIDLFTMCGWSLIYHTHDSRRSSPGFPDLVMARAPRVIFAECKSEEGKLTSEQAKWLWELGACPDPVEVYCWRPSQWGEIESVAGNKKGGIDV